MDILVRGSQLIHKKTRVVSVVERRRRDMGVGVFIVNNKDYSERQLRETFDAYRINRFVKGDRVRIKTLQEFKRSHKNLVLEGYDRFGVRIPRSFSEDMNQYCGKTYTIESAKPVVNTYYLKGINTYVFSREMFAENNEIYSEI